MELKFRRVFNNIKDHFFLKNTRIKLIFGSIWYGTAWSVRVGNYNFIKIDSNRYKKAKNSVIKGLLAHELSHAEYYNKLSFLNYIAFIIKYTLSKRYRIKTERETDITTIRKGFGKDLLALRNYSYKYGKGKYLKILKRNYLSIKEIKQYIKNK